VWEKNTKVHTRERQELLITVQTLQESVEQVMGSSKEVTIADLQSIAAKKEDVYGAIEIVKTKLQVTNGTWSQKTRRNSLGTSRGTEGTLDVGDHDNLEKYLKCLKTLIQTIEANISSVNTANQ